MRVAWILGPVAAALRVLGAVSAEVAEGKKNKTMTLLYASFEEKNEDTLL